jgi:hypothetical protein
MTAVAKGAFRRLKEAWEGNEQAVKRIVEFLAPLKECSVVLSSLL